MKKIKIYVKIPSPVYLQMMADLQRSHAFAYERVGFMFGTHKIVEDTMIVWINQYQPVADENYINDDTVGARINSAAIRSAMQTVLTNNYSCFHVHLHNHIGRPLPSLTDRAGLPGVVRSMSNVRSIQPHGYAILSKDSFYFTMNIAGGMEEIQPTCISIIGNPSKFVFPENSVNVHSEKYSRQSFLGKDAQFIFENIRVGIVGLGGGGSHVAQQLAHLGILNPVIFDSDHIEESNLNRLIGGWFKDIASKKLKTKIAERMMKNILPGVKVVAVHSRWQDNPEAVQGCDIIISGMDDYASRAELEAECRRYLIPYIDIGMDIHADENHASYMSGQVITSIPGGPCMRCMQFITEEKLVRKPLNMEMQVSGPK